jgi:uncharacterized protein
MARKFLADAMLGSLARWLRVLGCDTHYQGRYKAGDLPLLLSEGRILLSRNRKTVERIPDAVLILSERLREQIVQMKSSGLIPPSEGEWFTRCLVCNVSLVNVDPAEAQEHVPEHVIYETPGGIRRCPSCGRCFWPGTHRERMMMQLREWGF